MISGTATPRLDEPPGVLGMFFTSSLMYNCSRFASNSGGVNGIPRQGGDLELKVHVVPEE